MQWMWLDDDNGRTDGPHGRSLDCVEVCNISPRRGRACLACAVGYSPGGPPTGTSTRYCTLPRKKTNSLSSIHRQPDLHFSRDLVSLMNSYNNSKLRPRVSTKQSFLPSFLPSFCPFLITFTCQQAATHLDGRTGRSFARRLDEAFRVKEGRKDGNDNEIAAHCENENSTASSMENEACRGLLRSWSISKLLRACLSSSTSLGKR